ncbi:MAG: bifunctional phosphoribosyl-AMP cyclohydrolase/phosphoribosyl-ATP diphosphatase HisIE [Robiginitomaculum sp.]
MNINTVDFEKGGGLVPVIVQNADSLHVLMLGYMNKDALAKTQESGLVTFYSRSRKCLWTKGETSGNTLSLVDMAIDCDNDTLLIMARPKGPTCHTGTISCFGKDGAPGLGFLSELETLIKGRKNADPDSSYTASLLQGPLRRMAQKVGEEGVEVALAAVAETPEKLTSEAADLLYHMMVLLAAKDVSLADVIAELRGR